MSHAFNNPEIVYRSRRTKFLDRLGHTYPHAVHKRIVDFNGVHMNAHMHVHLFVKLSFYFVDKIMTYHKIVVGGNLGVHDCKYIRGSVIMDHQVVHSQNTFIAEQSGLDGIHQFFIRNSSEQRIYGAFDQRSARKQNKNRNCQPCPSVNIQTEYLHNDSSRNDHGSGNNVISAVCRARRQSRRIYLLPELQIHAHLKHLQKHGYSENDVSKHSRTDHFRS